MISRKRVQELLTQVDGQPAVEADMPEHSWCQLEQFVALLQAEATGIRPDVLYFARAMEKRLREKDGEHGNSYRHVSTANLSAGVMRAHTNMQQSEFVLRANKNYASTPLPGHAVDTANYAMFLFLAVAGV